MSNVNLLALDRQQLTQFFKTLGEPAYRAQQVMRWIFQRFVTDIDQWSDISKALREKLKQHCVIEAPTVVFDKTSKDGTRKWLFHIEGANNIEAVFIPEANRGTLCISSQVGCALNCKFCSTGYQGFNRNLKVNEIIGQLWVATQKLNEAGSDTSITNVVMMGMGEPLLNLDNVLPSLHLMLDDWAFGMSKRRVTVSTSGVVPGMDKLFEDIDVALALSLHAPNDALRSQIVPLNKKYPIKAVLAACRRYLSMGERQKKHVTMEYVMLKGVNDTDANAKELVHLLRDMAVKINLIPWNPFPNAPYERSSDHQIERFKKILMNAGYIATVRKTRGDDIDAACGQLVGDFQDRTRRRRQIPVALATQN